MNLYSTSDTVGGRLSTTNVNVNKGGSASLDVETKLKIVCTVIDVNVLLSTSNDYKIK